MIQLFLRELAKCSRLIQVIPMDMSSYYGECLDSYDVCVIDVCFSFLFIYFLSVSFDFCSRFAFHFLSGFFFVFSLAINSLVPCSVVSMLIRIRFLRSFCECAWIKVQCNIRDERGMKNEEGMVNRRRKNLELDILRASVEN